MKTRHIRGTTDYLNGLNLPEGMVGIDEERKALRFYDGSTVGGYEMLGTQAVEILYGPGPQTLLAGDMSAGFFGEVTSSELLTYEALAAQIGLSAGGSTGNESIWLKFALGGKILFVAKHIARTQLTWNNIYQAGGVLDSEVSKTIQLGVDQLRVTLIRGADNNPPSNTSLGYNPPQSQGSEWNRLMYQVHDGNHGNSSDTTPPGAWASYSDEDLSLTRAITWCLEGGGSSYVARSGNGLTRYFTTGSTSNYGWRPVLRLMSI